MFRRIGFFLLATAGMWLHAHSQFTEVASITGVDLGGRKDGGLAWGDFNQDGCPDLLVNSDNNGVSTRLYLSDCNLPNPTFTDVTTTHATGLLARRMERSAIWADFNNDGYLDFARNTHNRFELYRNQGPTGSPAYSFGDANHFPDLVISNIPNGMNTEGFGWADYNEDGWLDLIMDNHNFGIDIYQNPADGSANFTHVTPNGNSLGLPTGSRTGDYMALSDYNDDGRVDILGRKENESDIWQNNGFGAATQFVANPSFNAQANNSNKGGVLFADFDNDGDFDMFWGDDGGNAIFLQTAPNTFTATNEPGFSSGVDLNQGDIDGVAAADVNHDGKIDLFVADNKGSSFLFLNQTPNGGALSFTHSNLGIDVQADGEGCAFADYDQDGDMDLYINVNNGPNQLWRNGLNNANYLKVRAMFEISASASRDDIGATVTLLDCFGNVVSGIRDVNGTRGHGSQDYPEIHFGLPNGNTSAYVVRVAFTHKNGNRAIVEQSVVPATLAGQTLVIGSTGVSDLTGCQVLAEEGRFGLSARAEDAVAKLSWQGLPLGGRFEVMRSGDGVVYEEIGEVEADGKSGYAFEDVDASEGKWWYRVDQWTADGALVRSEVAEMVWAGKPEVVAYPQPLPAGSILNIDLAGFDEGPLELVVLDLRGKLIRRETIPFENNRTTTHMNTNFPAGLYHLQIRQGTHLLRKKVLVQ